MKSEAEKIGHWHLPEPTDAEEIAYLRHSNALLRESIKQQSKLFNNIAEASERVDLMREKLKNAQALTSDADTLDLASNMIDDTDYVLHLLGGML